MLWSITNSNINININVNVNVNVNVIAAAKTKPWWFSNSDYSDLCKKEKDGEG
jgi:hypothetical protein